MKNISELIRENKESSINENFNLALTFAPVFAQICMAIAIVIGENYDPDSPSLFDRISSWWKDQKAKKIIKKLADDKEIQDFLNQPMNKQHKGWRDLLRMKLTDDEFEYITRITKNKVKRQIDK